jgi:1-deoxy-D-xylulose-5-phosphate synthase
MAAGGMKPFAAIYSTFLQRGYDQVVHDVAIQRLPVRFAIDRAGLVGPTARPMRAATTSPICRTCPASWSWPPPTRRSWCTWSATALAIDDRPSAFRYPRGEGVGVEMPERGRRWRSARAA